MNSLAKFLVASVFALSGGIPAFAAHSGKMAGPAQYLRTDRATAHDAMDARAYAPEEGFISAPAFAPGAASVQTGPDFGIGSQR